MIKSELTTGSVDDQGGMLIIFIDDDSIVK
jgi:hypothetical protein